MHNPLVSISCITYNHVHFIKQCLDGFLMQQCNFDYEILIHDDASTDGTSDIIREYHEKYPEIIKPLIQTENQWSKGVRGINARFNFSRAKGKYIALCEGDDYWTDPLKLQKQVDFLESNPEYVLCASGYSTIDENGTFKKKSIFNEGLIKINEFDGIIITKKNFFSKWYTKTLTLVIRKDIYEIIDLTTYKYANDNHLNYELLCKGNGFYFSEVLGAYRLHSGGVHSLQSDNYKNILAYKIYRELHLNHLKDEVLKEQYKKFTRRIIERNLYTNNIKRKDLFLFLIMSINSIKDVKYLVKKIIGYKS